MTVKEVLAKLQSMGNASTQNIYARQGMTQPCYGVKIADLKVILKQVKNDQQLALELYDTGIIDAMYLAGLIADGSKMTKKQIQSWADKAQASMISEYTVPWVAAESHFGHELAMEWIDSKKEHVSAAGWSTLAALVAMKDDTELEMSALKKLLEKVQKSIHQSPNRVRYTMNGFIIAMGCYVSPLTTAAEDAGKKIGKVAVNMGDSACKVPFSPEYIKKVKDMGRVGVKRKTVKC